MSSLQRILMAFFIGIFTVPVQGETLDFKWLENYLKHNDVRTIDKLLKKFPKKYRTNPVLLFHSRSLQGASFENPRVILSGDDARFVVAFNGDKAQKGYDFLEIIHFLDAEKKFELREVEFSPRVRAKVSEPNPVRCLTCHQSATRANIDPRPNWEPYSVWPGTSSESLISQITCLNPESMCTNF